MEDDLLENTGVAETACLELGDMLVSYLNQLGIEYVFGVPGGAIEPLYNALARSERQGGARAVVSRHETGAAFMADGYSRNTGKLGVCCATTGPGATNMLTGVASAYENQVPLLAISAQTALSMFGKGAAQDSSSDGIDTSSLYEHCTRYNTLISHAEQFEHKLATAIMTSMASPKGPVHITVPRDIMETPWSGQVNYQLANLIETPSMLDKEALGKLYKLLCEAKRIVFIIGSDAKSSIGSVLCLVMHLNAELVTTPQGKGLVSPYHPRFRGVFGFTGHSSARQALLNNEVDLVVAVGVLFGETSSGGWDKECLLNSRLVHVEETTGHLTRTPMAKLHVRGSLRTIFDQLNKQFSVDTDQYRRDGRLEHVGTIDRSDRDKLEGIRHFTIDNEQACKSNSSPIKPQRLMHDLPKLFPSNTRYLMDVGNSFAWGTHYLHPYDRRMAGGREQHGILFSACFEFASMGWAIGSAVGTAMAVPNTPIVCVTGDGSWLMSGQEITVALEERLSIIFIIINDSAYGMVKHGQILSEAEQTAYKLPKVNYCAMAEAMGAFGSIVDSPEQLNELDINAICNRSGPTLLDIRIDPDEVPPISMRTNILAGNQ